MLPVQLVGTVSDDYCLRPCKEICGIIIVVSQAHNILFRVGRFEKGIRTAARQFDCRAQWELGPERLQVLASEQHITSRNLGVYFHSPCNTNPAQKKAG